MLSRFRQSRISAELFVSLAGLTDRQVARYTGGMARRRGQEKFEACRSRQLKLVRCDAMQVVSWHQRESTMRVRTRGRKADSVPISCLPLPLPLPIPV